MSQGEDAWFRGSIDRDGSSQVRELYMAFSIGTRELPISPILHPWRWRIISPPASARTSDFTQRRHPSTGSARRNQDGTQALQYIDPFSFLSVSYVSRCRPKCVLARHAPYLLTSILLTHLSSSTPHFSPPSPFSLRYFSISKSENNASTPTLTLFLLFWNARSVLRSFAIHILVNNWAYMWLTRTMNAHRSKRRWKQIYE